jgi:hypothetical protein
MAANTAIDIFTTSMRNEFLKSYLATATPSPSIPRRAARSTTTKR